MIKILFIIPELGIGGAEKISSDIANWFSGFKEYEVTILLLREFKENEKNKINPEVKTRALNLKGRIRYSFGAIIKAILNQKPNICFWGVDSINIQLAPFVPLLRKSGVKVIVRETNVLSLRFKPTIINKLLYRLFYNNYKNIICQSNDMRDDLINTWKIKSNKLSIINNPIDVDYVKKMSSLAACHDSLTLDPFFVAVGRLSPQKGYERMIKLIDYLDKKKKFPFKLIILGDGKLRDTLEETIKLYDLTDKVFLLGKIDNPYIIMSKAKGLILGSNFEGFPNVLLEANALGIPVFSNLCPGGIDEIIVEGENGYTANFDDEKNFEDRFELFINNKFNKNRIIELTRRKYDTSVIMPKYKKYFDNVMKKNK